MNAILQDFKFIYKRSLIKVKEKKKVMHLKNK